MKFPAIKGLLLGKRASPRAFEEKWVDPLYMGVPGYGKGEQNDFWCAVDRVYSEISEQLVGELLDRNDWRSRKVGGFFAGLRLYSSILPRIEALLVESKFCYSGIGYCFALVRFSSAESSAALRRYLDVWLPRTDCCYDQMVALGSLVTLDRLRNENHSTDYLAPGGVWDRFINAQTQIPRSAPTEYAAGLDKLLDVIARKYDQPNQLRDADANKSM